MLIIKALRIWDMGSTISTRTAMKVDGSNNNTCQMKSKINVTIIQKPRVNLNKHLNKSTKRLKKGNKPFLIYFIPIQKNTWKNESRNQSIIRSFYKCFLLKCVFKKEDKKDREVRGGEALSNGKASQRRNSNVSFLLDFLNNRLKCPRSMTKPECRW